MSGKEGLGDLQVFPECPGGVLPGKGRAFPSLLLCARSVHLLQSISAVPGRGSWSPALKFMAQ